VVHVVRDSPRRALVTAESREASDDAIAARLRGFGPLGALAILGILAGNLLVVPVSAVLVLLWARRTSSSSSMEGLRLFWTWIGTASHGPSWPGLCRPSARTTRVPERSLTSA